MLTFDVRASVSLCAFCGEQFEKRSSPARCDACCHMYRPASSTVSHTGRWRRGEKSTLKNRKKRTSCLVAPFHEPLNLDFIGSLNPGITLFSWFFLGFLPDFFLDSLTPKFFNIFFLIFLLNFKPLCQLIRSFAVRSAKWCLHHFTCFKDENPIPPPPHPPKKGRIWPHDCTEIPIQPFISGIVTTKVFMVMFMTTVHRVITESIRQSVVFTHRDHGAWCQEGKCTDVNSFKLSNSERKSTGRRWGGGLWNELISFCRQIYSFIL